MALFNKKRAKPDDETLAELKARQADLQTHEDAVAKHHELRDELNTRVEASQDAKAEALKRIAQLKADIENLNRGGDSPELQAIASDMAKLQNVAGIHDAVINAAQAKLRSMEVQEDKSSLQRAHHEKRQAWFRALRAHLVSQITPDVMELICDAHMASAQGGEGTSFGVFCEHRLRTDEYRATGNQNRFGEAPERVAYANRLTEQYEALCKEDAQ
jgi:hypothetical protein